MIGEPSTWTRPKRLTTGCIHVLLCQNAEKGRPRGWSVAIVRGESPWDPEKGVADGFPEDGNRVT